MGHTRLGTLPKSRPWKAVVELLAGSDDGDGTDARGSAATDFGQDVARVAEKAMDGAAAAFEQAQRDVGIADAFFLLTRVAVACRSGNPSEALWELGLHLPAEPGRADVLREVNRVLDDTSLASRTRTDLSEMGQAAVAEALAGWLRSRDDQASLFAPPGDKLWVDLRSLATQEGFADVCHRAFAGLTSRLLGFYLSREVRPLKKGLVGGVADLRRFEDELRRHAMERARIARDFAGTWFTKHEFQQGGIDRAKTRRFVGYALRKVATELRGGPRRA